MKRFLINILFLIVLSNTMFSQGVNIKLAYPPKANNNEEFEIKINIAKGDISGFARLQIDFPEGFTVKSTQVQGATFSYKENKARFLWMSLPSESELNVNCLVTVASSVGGSQEFEGTFSYVLDNETQREPISKQNIIIGDGEAIVQNEVVKEKENLIEKTEETENVDKTAEEAEKLEAERKARELAIAKAEQEKRERDEKEKQIKEETERKAREEAEILEKERLAREAEEARLAETLKEEEKTTDTNQEAEKIEQERKAKEEAERFEQERKAREEAEQIEKERLARLAEEARLAETVKEEEKTTDTNQEAEKIEQERLAKEQTIARLEAEKIEKENALKEKERLERERIERENANRIKENYRTTTSGVNKAAVSSELDYRVQVGASRQIAEPGYYTKLNKAIPEFDVLQNDGDDGWYRYTIGSFKDVNSAQNLLSKVKQLGYDCFLVAFKDGKRMTINDAKKITTQ